MGVCFALWHWWDCCLHSFRIRLFCVNKSVTAEEARGSAVSFTVCLKEQFHCGLYVRSFQNEQWKHAQVHGRSSPAASEKKAAAVIILVFSSTHARASGPVETRHCWVCVLISHISQKGHFQPNTLPSLPATNANHLVVGKMTLIKPREAQTDTHV